MNKSINYLTIEDMEWIFDEVYHFLKELGDPVPEFTSSFHDKVESIIARPQDTFDKHDLYPDIYSKAACYFYFINALHPLMNGNKRMSMIATYVFLRKNRYLFHADGEDIFYFAQEISNVHIDKKEKFEKVVEFIKKYTKKM